MFVIKINVDQGMSTNKINKLLLFLLLSFFLQFPHSSLRNLADAKRKPEKIQARTGFKPMTSAMPVQCSTN